MSKKDTTTSLYHTPNPHDPQSLAGHPKRTMNEPLEIPFQNDSSVTKRMWAEIQFSDASKDLDRFDGKRVVTINANVHGFGDAIVCAWISEGAKGSDVHVRHFARGRKAELIRMLDQDVTSNGDGAVTTFAAYNTELRNRGNPPRIYSRGVELGILTTPKRPRIVLDQQALDWAYDIKPQGPCVLLAPNTYYGSREWPECYWHELGDILEDSGIRTLWIGDKADKRYSKRPRHYAGEGWDATAALMYVCQCVVGNDSGPAHLAGTLDVPTVVLLGPSNPSVFAQYPSVTCLQAPQSELPCSGCYWKVGVYQDVCERGCVALSHITPTDVLEAIRSKLSGRFLLRGRRLAEDGQEKTCHQITNDLAVGSAAYADQLSREGWSCLVLVAEVTTREPCHRIALADNGANPPERLWQAIHYVVSAWRESKKVAVLCRAGFSRSVSIAAGALLIAGRVANIQLGADIIQNHRKGAISPGMLESVSQCLNR